MFPWVLESQFYLGPLKVSLRGLGNAFAALLILIGLSLIFFQKFRDRLTRLAQELDDLSVSDSRKFIFYSTILIAIPLISYKLRAHYCLGTHAYDLGLFSNICFNTAAGDWFYSSLYERNFMAIHVNWILWPLSFFYKLGAGAGILQAFQVIFMVSAIPFLWSATHKILDSFSAGLIASLLYICSPYIGQSMGNDFHPDAWQLPCLMAALWAWQRNFKPWVVLFSSLALLAKEDVSIVLCGFAIFLMLKKNWRGTGALIGAISLSVFFFHIHIFIPKFIDESLNSVLFDRYELLGGSFKEILFNLFFNPPVLIEVLSHDPVKYWRFLNYFFPMGLLTFLSPLFLIPIFISVLPHLLSQASTQLQLADIYSFPSQAFLFIGAAYGAKKLLEINTFSGKKNLLASALIIIAGFGIINTPRFYRKVSPEKRNSFYKLKKLVPPQVSLSAQQNLLPHFDTRRYIQLFPIGIGTPYIQPKYLDNPEFIVADRTGNSLPTDGAHLAKALQDLSRDSRYEKIFDENDFLVYQRIRPESLIWKDFEIPEEE